MKLEVRIRFLDVKLPSTAGSQAAKAPVTEPESRNWMGLELGLTVNVKFFCDMLDCVEIIPMELNIVELGSYFETRNWLILEE